MEDIIYEKDYRNKPEIEEENLDFLTPEGKILLYRMKGILDCFEKETEFDRTTIFKAVLAKMSSLDEKQEIMDPMNVIVYLAERMLEKALNGELELSNDE